MIMPDIQGLGFVTAAEQAVDLWQKVEILGANGLKIG